MTDVSLHKWLKSKPPLLENEPFHIPGYNGNQPQLRYRCGQPFSPATHTLLINPDVHKSSHSVLSKIDTTISSEDAIRDTRKLILERRCSFHGDPKFTHPMVPGYTGKIPNMDFQEGKTYSTAAFTAISDFENKQQRKQEKLQELRDTTKRQYCKDLPLETLQKLPPLLTEAQLPLRKIREDMLPYKSSVAYQYKDNVYKLPNSDKDKRYNAGYMGFVPRTLEKFGKDWESTTHAGLNEFTDDMMKRRVVLSTPVTVHKEEPRFTDGVKIYHQTEGLVPKYTGHAPGGRYKFGRTYRESTYNAKEKFLPAVQPWTLQQQASSLP